MGDYSRGGRRFAVDAVVPQNNRMLGAETVLPHFRTYDVTRANPLASFASGAADPNTYCGQPCARAILLPSVERRGGQPRRAASKSRHIGRYPVRAPSIVRAVSERFCGGISFRSLR